MLKTSDAFTGKVALITGSGRGIGRAIAEHFAESGAKVVVTSNVPRDVRQTVSAIRRRGGTALGFPLDLRDQPRVQRMVRAVLKDWKTIDILVTQRRLLSQARATPRCAVQNGGPRLSTSICFACFESRSWWRGRWCAIGHPGDKKAYLEAGRIPLRRYGTRDECARLVLFLASENCAGMTGETVQQDGGLNFIY